MTTTTSLHYEIERTRFANLLLAALGAAVPASLAALFGRDRDASADPVAKAALEAQSVREMARSYANSDPGFAADLYAAAARHEGLSEF